MAKKDIDNCILQYGKIVSRIKAGSFDPVYILMGEEPFFCDKIISLIEETALMPDEKGFNQMILYGSDVNAVQVIETARRFPMMASRQVVIVKEAQLMPGQDELNHYMDSPQLTTILVLLYTNKVIDKRERFYKTANGKGWVFETFSLYDSMIAPWIESYLKERGLKIRPDAARLMAEYCGTELRKIAGELDKLITGLSSEVTIIEPVHIEENIGISREYNVFELTKALSINDVAKAIKIVKHFGAAPKQFPLVVTLATLFNHFSRIMKYHDLLSSGSRPAAGEIASYLSVHPYFVSEFESAARYYSLRRCMEAISLIRVYDSKSKSNLRGEAEDGDLLLELIHRLLH